MLCDQNVFGGGGGNLACFILYEVLCVEFIEGAYYIVYVDHCSCAVIQITIAHLTTRMYTSRSGLVLAVVEVGSHRMMARSKSNIRTSITPNPASCSIHP